MPVQPWPQQRREEIARAVAAGMSYDRISAELRVSTGMISKIVRERGGVPPRRTWRRSPLRLSLADREERSRGLSTGASLRKIAEGMGRAVSTVSREVANNGGREGYRAWVADREAYQRARRPRPAKLAVNSRLRAEVEAGLARCWSPQQIAARLRHDHPHEPEMWVSHETIYQALYVQGRGQLRRELHQALRTGRAKRRSQARSAGDRRISGMVMISERPAEVADRAVPGHWEGDLIIGKAGRSQIGTLVERTTRYLLLLELADKTSQELLEAMTRQIVTLPRQLRRSLTWDQGCEMARHAQFTIATGIPVYFCDPHSPWQRGSNENTNGLLRQYFPKGTDLSGYRQTDLDTVAAELNGRPRHTLGWQTPAEKLDQLLR